MEDKLRASDKIEKLSPRSIEKITLVAIASFADRDGSRCYPSIEKVAAKMGRSERMVQKHIRNLCSRCSYPRIGASDDGSDEANAELRVLYNASPLGTNVFLFHVLRTRFENKRQMKLPLNTPVPTSEITIGPKLDFKLKSDTEQMIADAIEKLEREIEADTTLVITPMNEEIAAWSAEEIHSYLEEEFQESRSEDFSFAERCDEKSPIAFG